MTKTFYSVWITVYLLNAYNGKGSECFTPNSEDKEVFLTKFKDYMDRIMFRGITRFENHANEPVPVYYSPSRVAEYQLSSFQNVTQGELELAIQEVKVARRLMA